MDILRPTIEHRALNGGGTPERSVASAGVFLHLDCGNVVANKMEFRKKDVGGSMSIMRGVKTKGLLSEAVRKGTTRTNPVCGRNVEVRLMLPSSPDCLDLRRDNETNLPVTGNFSKQGMK
jgi:hypothetical protein